MWTGSLPSKVAGSADPASPPKAVAWQRWDQQEGKEVKRKKLIQTLPGRMVPEGASAAPEISPDGGVSANGSASGKILMKLVGFFTFSNCIYL